MDNNDLYFQSINANEEELALGRNRQHFLHKQICTRFEPYRQHFLTQPVAVIRHSRPQFIASRSMTLRDNMKVERQVKHVKSTVAEDYGQEVLEDLLGEEAYQPVKRLKNVSVIYDGKYYWAEDTRIKHITINDFLSKSKIQANRQVWSVGLATAVEMLDIHEWIYELALYNSLFFVRTPRRLILIDPVLQKIVQDYPSEGEITNFHHYISRECEKVLLTTYEDKFSHVFQQQLHSEQKMQLWCKIDGLINALWIITDSEVLICKENAILLADRRRKAIIDLHRRAQCHNNRIYSGISLEDTVFGPRYFLTTQSKTVNVYDIRRAYEPVLKMNHYCEEAPPSILQIWNKALPTLSKDLDQADFDSFLSESLQYQTQNPLLITHSPYATGASLFTQLSIDCSAPQEILKKQTFGETNQFSNRFQLLYDPGKLYEHYHPRSITPIPLQSQVGFIHLDNYNGISLEIFEKMSSNQNIKAYKRNNQLNEIYQRVDFMKQEGVDQLKDPNMEWYGNYTVEKQLQGEEEDYWTETMEEDQLQLQGNQYQKKVIRYADLKKFYHQVLEQSKTYPLSEKLKEEESNNRKYRQPQSQSNPNPNLFSQSQTQASQSITQTLSYNLSPSAILSLLQQWNPS